MLDEMLALIREHNLAVLATSGPEGPHASLMTYLSAEQGGVIYLITLAGTSKFANLGSEPRVSLLIDDRDQAGGQGIRALTVEGEAEVVDEGGQAQVLKDRFAAELPHLADLAQDPECRVLAIRVRSLLLLDGPTQATYLELG